MIKKNLRSLLSRRELEVADLISDGLSNLEVANICYVQEKTIKFHATRIFKKLGVKNRIDLCIRCRE